jgi:hypothetical protein
MDAIATRIRVSALCLVHKGLHIPLQHNTSMNKLDLLQGLKCITLLSCDLFGLYTMLAFSIGFGGVLTFYFLFFFLAFCCGQQAAILMYTCA